jgi:hypothetical protein
VKGHGGVLAKTGTADEPGIKGPDFDCPGFVKTGLSSDPRTIDGQGSKHGFEAPVRAVWASVMERIRTTDYETGTVRFEIETDQGQMIRVRLAVDSNLVSARIDAPNEQIRDLLAGHASELNQQLEAEGLIPNDIDFCLAGGRQQAADNGERPDIRSPIAVTARDEDALNLTMVESETYAFESWA